MQEIQDQIIDIQTRMAFQEETIDQLNNVIIDQQKTIDQLKRKLLQLDKKVQEESQHWQNDAGMQDEKPPHY